MDWFLYILECRDGSLYTGITTNVARRLAEHAGGRGARYTRSHPPRRLRALVVFPDKGSALSAEYAFKSLTRAAKLAFCLAHADSVSDDFSRLLAP